MAPPEGGPMALERLNAHPRDDRIVFDEASHKYTLDADKNFTISVSGLVHEYFPNFDATKVVNQYYKSWSENKTSKYFALIRYLKHVVGIDNEDDIKAEIAASWNAAGTAASGAGTATHLDIELFLNKDPSCDLDNPDLQQFYAWRATPPFDTWQPYRTEWSVYDEKACVAGQIDSLWVAPDGSYHMVRFQITQSIGIVLRFFAQVDWKRCAKIETKTSFGETGHQPFDDLPNTNHGHYTLQQASQLCATQHTLHLHNA
jgi:hypothetical protein